MVSSLGHSQRSVQQKYNCTARCWEIRLLSGKRMEQRLMSLIPLCILGYVGITSPGFFDGMYHTVTGVVIMTLLLLVYAAAYVWGERIMNIQV